jgi:hypothetical protein
VKVETAFVTTKLISQELALRAEINDSKDEIKSRRLIMVRTHGGVAPLYT